MKNFQRITLNAGSSTTVTFDITPEMLQIVNEEGKRMIERGKFPPSKEPTLPNILFTRYFRGKDGLKKFSEHPNLLFIISHFLKKENQNMEKGNTCKTPRWRLLKAVLNNLDAVGFKAKIEAGNTIIVDVRKLEEYQQMHLPDVVHINYFEETFWEKIEQLDKTKDILVYCRSGRRSIRVCTLMKNGGFDAAKVFNLDGGIVDWLTHFPKEVETE